MDEQEKQKLIKAAIKELGIDKPIMSHRVVGNRIELHLYGGDTVIYAASSTPLPVTAATRATTHGPDEIDLTSLTRAELISMAKQEEIPGRSKMNKTQLIKALKEPIT